MNTYAMRNFLFALVARASGLDVRQPPELTTVTIRSMTITTTRTVTTHPVLWTNTTIQTLPPIEPSTASVSNITGGALGTGATAATSVITETSISGTEGSCITVTPNVSVRPSLLPSTSSRAVSKSTEGDQTMSSVTALWPRPGIADPPEAPLSSSSVPYTTSSSLVTSSSPASSSTPDPVESSTSIRWSISPTISSTKLLNSTSQSSDLPTSTSSKTFTTKTSSQVASVSTATASDGTGYGEATMILPTVDLSRPDQSSSSFSPTTPHLSIPSPSSTIHVVAIDVLGF
ncbi:uncharacterized protein F4817DRAFT_312780 [Daldinia loculata]|uniref:uncharacterized protein n=1 Tax=Daldinia loculata TaxID=103429 RepID=UPI0020C4861E|nr:uncharacterized protein F4817DRAFT_312780 [Daldinia loculata]KAI1650413.1 hypothetical protein F4817DRAFT_312780 [Daldinia loculata]